MSQRGDLQRTICVDLVVKARQVFAKQVLVQLHLSQPCFQLSVLLISAPEFLLEAVD